jgi:8-oxo-(d)GTP phosphatase
MPDGGTAAELRAAGAVLWRPGDADPAAGPMADLQVAVIHRPKYDDWSFAKGKLEPGEHVLHAAVREVFEETGMRVTLGRRLPPVRYAYQGRARRADDQQIPAAASVADDRRGRVLKQVDYWAATAAGASSPFLPNKEVDRLDWLSVTGARQRLSYPHDVELLDQFSAGPPRTTPLIFLRHASAGSRSDWPGEDASRPLDALGVKQAQDLAGLLRCFGVLRVVSSPTERCVSTVRPYATAAGVAVEPEPALLPPNGDGSWAGHARAAATAALVAAEGQPVVVCAHRENLPVLIAAACDRLGGTLPEGPPLRKSEFLVLHTSAGKLVTAERHVTDEAGLAAKRPRVARGEIPVASFLANPEAAAAAADRQAQRKSRHTWPADVGRLCRAWRRPAQGGTRRS